MRALLLILIASSALGQGRFDRFNQRTDQGRSTRGFQQSSLAFFEFAPTSGAGMGTACACTTPTGAKGETMTFTRTGAATCSPLGLATTGITNASLVECSANLPRVESASGVLGLRVEGSRTNVLTRFIDYANATWADVGTPTLTGAQASPWTGTYANLAVQFDDNDGAAFEGRTQTVTVTAATAYTMSCYVKAGTLAAARLSLDGTTADFTGLSSSTWTIITVADASSSGVAIAAQALNGSTAAATGTVIWGGCQVEAGAYATSMIPTVAAGVTRNEEQPQFTISGWTATTQWCLAASIASDPKATGAVGFIAANTGAFPSAGPPALLYGAASRRLFDGAADRVVISPPLTAARLVGRCLPSSSSLDYNATSGTGAACSTTGVLTRVGIGFYDTASQVDSIVTRVQLDSLPSRCTP